ncbi:MAG: UDP-N-acetylmuramoyl-L-alanyl-D-glutamate--2,6-diaminopimelate ligase [Gemmatimonadota bacterium]
MTPSVSHLTLADLARLVGGRVEGDPETRIEGVAHDSRRARPGDLFAAVPGFEVDGRSFVADAVERGAKAVLVSTPGPWAVPALIVEDVRAALGPIAHRIEGDVTGRLAVVGVTGTNGKTTTSFLTAAVLAREYGDVAVLGTLGVRRGERVTETGFTTPEAPDLARLFRELDEDGVGAVSMEVSSHAIELGRIRGVRFRAGAFTNLSEEHLDFHGTMERYAEVKLSFFRLLAEQDAFAAVNLDDAWGSRFLDAGPPGAWTYSLEDPAADVHAERMEAAPDGTRLVVRTPAGRFETRLALAGRFNAANALAASALGAGLGIEPAEIGEALAEVRRVPGRYEVTKGGGVTAIVDYAHTPLAFERVLKAVRESGPKRIFCVFGCGGERDRGKRPRMARAAGSLSDVVYVTVDNPRREPIERIMEDTLPGFAGTSARWERIDDRETAIRRAIAEAEPGDVVCLLGKGDEGYQWIGTTKHPFSDREIAESALAARRASL